MTDPATGASQAKLPTQRSFVGRTLGGSYRILQSLDQGGMSMVFAAEHIRLKRRVAVKVLARHLTADENALGRFRREAEIISQLNHPNIVHVLDFDTTEEGEPYIVMELLTGESLADRLDREHALPLSDVVRFTFQIAAGLAYAHRASVVHRDLKPANVFLVHVEDQGSYVKLLDFGISKNAGGGRKITREFDILGTPDYMAPEQARGETKNVDHRADQYSLAAIAYEMLTGVVPFPGPDIMTVLRKVVTEEPRAMSEVASYIPAALDPVIGRALAKRPEHRYASVLEFAQQLALAAGSSWPSPAQSEADVLEAPIRASTLSAAPTPESADPPPVPHSPAAASLASTTEHSGRISGIGEPAPATPARAARVASETAQTEYATRSEDKSGDAPPISQREPRIALLPSEPDLSRPLVHEPITGVRARSPLEAERSQQSSPPADRSFVFDRPSPIVDRPSAIVDRPSPVVDRPSPVVDRPSPIVDRPSPVVDRLSAIVDRPSPVVDRPSPVVDRALQVEERRSSPHNAPSNQPAHGVLSATTPPAGVSRRHSPLSAPALDPVADLRHAIAEARQALGFEDIELAANYAEAALAIADRSKSPEVRELASAAANLFTIIFERRLGSLRRHITVRDLQKSDSQENLSPEHVFLLTRLDAASTVDEALDLSPLPRLQTLRLLVSLARHRLITLK